MTGGVDVDEDERQSVRIGVLALQGSFSEHISALRRVRGDHVDVIEVRKANELDACSGVVIPGGESTTMAKLAATNGLLDGLREFAASGKPIWGTCAGLIFLAKEACGAKEGGQALLGTLDVTVARNFFGSQVHSFETRLPAPSALTEAETSASASSCDGGTTVANGAPAANDADNAGKFFRAVFIRAPGIVRCGPEVEVLSEYALPDGAGVMVEGVDAPVEKVAVAVRQGNLLATAFHPELTSDNRWHALFKGMVIGAEKASA